MKLFILFGATGSLAKIKIFPALVELHTKGILDPEIKIVCYGRRDFDNNTFRSYLRTIGIDKDTFLQKVFYVKGDFNNDKIFASYIKNENPTKIFCYVSLLPSLYEQVVNFIYGSITNSQIRIALEKPFGTSFKSAEKLSGLVDKYGEPDFYLVDHYLAKEAVINFTKNIDIDDIAQIEASIFEEEGIGNRGSFYDETGAIIDTLQSHLVNTLADLVNKKDKDDFFENLKYKSNSLVVGQYQDYIKAEEVNPNSKTETYFKADFDYKGIGIQFRSGKSLDRTKTFVSILDKNGTVTEVVIKPNSKEIYLPHEHIISDFLNDEKNFAITPKQALLAWSVLGIVLTEKENSVLKIYPQNSSPVDIERL